MKQRFFVASWDGGVYSFEYDFNAESASSVIRVADTERASYFARDGRLLYVLAEIGEPGEYAGRIDSFIIEEDGGLTPVDSINGIPSGSPHLSLSADGKHIYTASYNNGKLCSADTEGGRFGGITGVYQQVGSSVDPERQEGPHAHIMCQSPEGDFIICCDLGTDKLNIYKINRETGTLVPYDELKVPEGYGPRHMLFSRDGKYAYVVCELRYHILTFSYDGRGGLTMTADLQVLEGLPEDKSWGGAIKLSEDGTLLFASNRPEGMSSIDVISLARPECPETVGGYQAVEHPRDFMLLNSEDGKEYILTASMTKNRLRMLEFNRENMTFRLMTEIRGIAKPVCLEKQ